MNFFKLIRLDSPLLKKNIAPKSFNLFRALAEVRDMVDLPVPAIPFN